LEYTATEQSFVAQALNAGLRRAHLGYAAMHEALESSVGEQTANLFRRIEMLNVIGNLGPLLGLMGTVLGMISAFYGIDRSHGEPKVADLAPGIAMALWHTFFGLFVAIPCLVAFGFFRTKLDRITTHAAVAAEDLLETLRPTPGATANNVGGPGHVPASNVATAAAKQVETVSAT
jgi:biopolymer transport protein ExbB